MGKSGSCEKTGLNKGKWTAEEDEKLVHYIKANGAGSWRSLPNNAGLLRCGKSCRLRWINYLREDVKRGNFSEDEEESIVKLHKIFGNKWSLIASHLAGRTDNEIKNYWNSHLSRRIYRFSSIKLTQEERVMISAPNCSAASKKNKYANKKPSPAPPRAATAVAEMEESAAGKINADPGISMQVDDELVLDKDKNSAPVLMEGMSREDWERWDLYAADPEWSSSSCNHNWDFNWYGAGDGLNLWTSEKESGEEEGDLMIWSYAWEA